MYSCTWTDNLGKFIPSRYNSRVVDYDRLATDRSLEWLITIVGTWKTPYLIE